MLPQLIGLNGFKGSGKDTAGAYLSAHWGYTPVSFAAALKKSAAALLDIEPEVWDGVKNMPEARIDFSYPIGASRVSRSFTAREFLQRYGTEAHREIFDTNFWVLVLMDTFEVGKRYVITDARFDNELEAIRAAGGINIRITRPDTASDGHASEPLPNWALVDHNVDNDSTIDDLGSVLDCIMRHHFDRETA